MESVNRQEQTSTPQILSYFSDRVEAITTPGNSMKMSKTSWWRCFVTANNGNHRRFSIFFRRSLAFPTAQTSLVPSFGILISRTRNHTRSRRPRRPENPAEILEERVDDALDEDEQLHNKHDGEDDEGWTVDDEVYTDVLFSDFLTHQSHSRTIIHGASGTWMVYTLSGSELRRTTLRSASMH